MAGKPAVQLAGRQHNGPGQLQHPLWVPPNSNICHSGSRASRGGESQVLLHSRGGLQRQSGLPAHEEAGRVAGYRPKATCPISLPFTIFRQDPHWTCSTVSSCCCAAMVPQPEHDSTGGAASHQAPPLPAAGLCCSRSLPRAMRSRSILASTCSRRGGRQAACVMGSKSCPWNRYLTVRLLCCLIRGNDIDVIIGEA